MGNKLYHSPFTSAISFSKTKGYFHSNLLSDSDKYHCKIHLLNVERFLNSIKKDIMPGHQKEIAKLVKAKHFTYHKQQKENLQFY